MHCRKDYIQRLLDSTQVVFYKIIGGGHSWPSGTESGSGSGNKNKDINANVELWNFFKGFKNNIPNFAYSKSLKVSHKYFPVQGDTLKVNSLLSNLENHQVEVYAMINGVGNTYKDSIELFDDGSHGDENPNDNIYGGTKWLSSLQEDNYT